MIQEQENVSMQNHQTKTCRGTISIGYAIL